MEAHEEVRPTKQQHTCVLHAPLLSVPHHSTHVDKHLQQLQH